MMEENIKLYKSDSYREFTAYISSFRNEFRSLFKMLRDKNKKIVGLGAPAKSVVLLNFTGIDDKTISYITDSTTYKQYKYMPGVHIPIMPESRIQEDKTIDYFLLLAWTYQSEMIKKIKMLKMSKVKVIIPFPKLRII